MQLCIHFYHFSFILKISKINLDESKELMAKRKVKLPDLDNNQSRLNGLKIMRIKRKVKGIEHLESQAHNSKSQGVDSYPRPRGNEV